MNQKHTGIILLIISILIGSFVLILQINNNQFADAYMETKGTCYLDDGTCLHKKDLSIYAFGWAISGALFLFGIYLTFFDNTTEILKKHQIKLSEALQNNKEEDKFKAYISTFNNDEQKILQSIKEQEGIKQSTLRFKTDISKTSLSLILKKLENKKIIKRIPDGKTKKVFLIKRY